MAAVIPLTSTNVEGATGRSPSFDGPVHPIPGPTYVSAHLQAALIESEN